MQWARVHGSDKDHRCGVRCGLCASALLKKLKVEFSTMAVRMLSVIEFNFPQVVLVSSLTMKQFAKYILSNHIQYGQYIAAITYILEHHHMGVMLLCSAHDIPVVFEAYSQDHFRANVLDSCTDGVKNHWTMPFPGCGDDHRINITQFAEFFQLWSLPVKIFGSFLPDLAMISPAIFSMR